MYFVVERTEKTGRRAIQFFISDNFSAPTVFAFNGMPSERQQSRENCAYSCQLHSPALAKCKIPPSTLVLSSVEGSASKNWGSICAISRVYVGVENLSAIASTCSSLRARLITASTKLGRSGPKTHETRTTRCRSCVSKTDFSPARFDSP